MKYNPMFSLRSKNEMKEFYKNPTVLVGIVAFVLTLLSCFIPYYVQADGVGISLEFLINSNFKSVVLTVTIINLVLVVASVVFSVLFKNTPKLSGLTMVLGGVILIAAIFQLLYCTKIGCPSATGDGRSVANFALSYGAICVIVASLLIVGNEFYKLGWQGYEVKEEPTTAKENVQTSAILEETTEEENISEIKTLEEKEENRRTDE